MEIKKISRDKIDTYVEIYRRVFSRKPWYIDESYGDVKKYFEKYFALNNLLGYELVEGERVLGFILGYKKPWIDGYEFYIDQFAMDIAYQGQGLGKYFLGEIEEDLYCEEVVNIILMTEENTGAYKFYKNLGFDELDYNKLLVREL